MMVCVEAILYPRCVRGSMSVRGKVEWNPLVWVSDLGNCRLRYFKDENAFGAMVFVQTVDFLGKRSFLGKAHEYDE
jgi:hypothetical protein